MLFFLYTAEFPEPENEKAMSLSFAHQVAMIADKYGVVALRDQAVTKMTTICKLNLVRWLKNGQVCCQRYRQGASDLASRA